MIRHLSRARNLRLEAGTGDSPDQSKAVGTMEDYRVVADSTVHRGRRLLINARGDGYLQLGSDSLPLPLSAHDFSRLRAMRHYRPVAVSARPARRALVAAAV